MNGIICLILSLGGLVTTSSAPDEFSQNYDEDGNYIEPRKGLVYDQDYNKYERPKPPPLPSDPYGTPPVQVQVFMGILNLGLRESTSGSLSILECDMFLTHKWNDSRLEPVDKRSRNFLLKPRIAEEIWRPDPMFSEAVKVERMSRPVENAYTEFFTETKTVLTMEKLSLEVPCILDLGMFPHDSQTCEIGLESMGHYLQQVDFDWLDEKPYKFYFDKMNIGNFLLTNHSHTKYIQNYSTGSIGRLKMNFTFKRSTANYLLMTYFPTWLLALLSWMTSWLDHKDQFTTKILMGFGCFFGTVGIQVVAKGHRLTLTALDVFFFVTWIFIMTNVISAFINAKLSPSLERLVNILVKWLLPALYILFNIIYWIIIATT